MDWKIWRDRGYCSLGETISAYVDFEPTPSGAIRCVGPFSNIECSLERMQASIKSLTSLLERSQITQHQFVLWGAYCDYPQYQEHKIDILGTTCGFMPIPWLRTHLLGYDPNALAREWEMTSQKVTHRSGLQFPNTVLSVVDPMLFHPSNSEESIAKLHEQAKQVGQDRPTNILEAKSIFPQVRWSLATIQNEKLSQRSRSA